MTNAMNWLSPALAARRLDVTPQWARKLAQRGQLRGVETALGWLIDPEDVERLARERKAGTTAAAI